MEGAGVLVNRVFGYHDVNDFDPFLMLDYFEKDTAMESSGFPWHPHKGIETISYFLKGSGMHEDSLGNKGVIEAGELQWMTAGKGILHQEMPGYSPNGVQGFQFWVNMHSSKKTK
jgi:redox-sensitive bicupin YhaK (pirin superfamily)